MNNNRSSQIKSIKCCQGKFFLKFKTLILDNLCKKGKTRENQLLQRVVRLQSEIQRRDVEIQQLRQNISKLFSNIKDPMLKQMDFYCSDLMSNEDEKLKGILSNLLLK